VWPTTRCPWVVVEKVRVWVRTAQSRPQFPFRISWDVCHRHCTT
jgi:hypothetical protein